MIGALHLSRSAEDFFALVGADQPWETVVVNVVALIEALVVVAEATGVTEAAAGAVAEVGAERMRRRNGFPAQSWAAWCSR